VGRAQRCELTRLKDGKQTFGGTLGIAGQQARRKWVTCSTQPLTDPFFLQRAWFQGTEPLDEHALEHLVLEIHGRRSLPLPTGNVPAGPQYSPERLPRQSHKAIATQHIE